MRELELERSVDTLGRWLAHHLAEVILLAETAEGAGREAAQKKAVDLILKLWARRYDLPGHSHPLKELEGVITILRLLKGDAWPYPRANNESVEQLLKKAFEGLQHIIAHGALLMSGVAGKPVAAGESAGFLEEDEAHLIQVANAWIDLYDSAPKHPAVVLVREDMEARDAEKAELEEFLKLDPAARARKVFAKQIDRLTEILNELRGRIAGESETGP